MVFFGEFFVRRDVVDAHSDDFGAKLSDCLQIVSEATRSLVQPGVSSLG